MEDPLLYHNDRHFEAYFLFCCYYCLMDHIYYLLSSHYIKLTQNINYFKNKIYINLLIELIDFLILKVRWTLCKILINKILPYSIHKMFKVFYCGYIVIVYFKKNIRIYVPKGKRE